MRNVEELSQMIIDSLCSRKGFDNWWFDLEYEDQEEIMDEIRNTYEEWCAGGETLKDMDGDV
mgnify:CR=1 FL=1